MIELQSTADLLDHGLSNHEIRRRVRDGRLQRIHPGYFVDTHRYRELSPEQQVLLKHRAYARAAHVTPVFCLASAAVVHGLGLRRVPSRIHTVSPPERGTHHGYTSVVRHEAVLAAADVVAVDGLRVTSAERTLLDCARLLPFTDAVVIADQAHHVGVSRSRLEKRLPQWAGRRGVRRARSVLAAMDPRSESVGETLTRLLLADSSLPMPRDQVRRGLHAPSRAARRATARGGDPGAGVDGDPRGVERRGAPSGGDSGTDRGRSPARSECTLTPSRPA